ncbi:uncharacterized protein LOC144204018 [Stigmatopora nigra]
MVLLLIYFHFVIQVLSEAPPVMPQHVLFDNWQLTWTPATEETTVNYTVMYRSFDSTHWIDIPYCKQIYSTYCNVTSMETKAEHGCVMLGVRAERLGLKSDPAIACSKQGNLCSPEVGLSVRPGSLTLHLSRKSGITEEGYFVKHRIYFGEEGEPLEASEEDAASSVSIDNLTEGKRYCASVQNTYFNIPVGLGSCPKCETIPQSRPPSKKTEITVTVVLLFVIIILVIVYILLYQRKRIKGWMQTSNKIPVPVEFPDLSHVPFIGKTPNEEICDIPRMDFRGL